MGWFGFGAPDIKGIDSPHVAILVAGYMLLFAIESPKAGASAEESDRFAEQSAAAKAAVSVCAARAVYRYDEIEGQFREKQRGKPVPSSVIEAAEKAARGVMREYGGTPAKPMDVKAVSKAIASVVEDDDDLRASTLGCALFVARLSQPNSRRQKERIDILSKALGIGDDDRRYVEGMVDENFDELLELVRARLEAEAE